MQGLVRERVLAATSEERRGMVEMFVREQAARVLRTSPAGVRMDLPLSELGLDSLMAVELSNRLEGELGVLLPMGKLAAGDSAGKLVELLMEALPAPP